MKKNVVRTFNVGLIVILMFLTACQSTISNEAERFQPVDDQTGIDVADPPSTPTVANTIVSESSLPQKINLSYPIVDTGQGLCYDNSDVINCPAQGTLFYGQDAQFSGNSPSYTDNGDGTVTDNVTGLVWQKSPDTNGDGNITAADKMSHTNSASYCENLSLAGFDDWQLPTIKQLYSLIDFTGVDPSGYEGTDTSGLIPFINTDYFDFAYGDTDSNERIIDSQYASSTYYVGNSEQYLFGVNFADGRIKGYGLSVRGKEKTFLVTCIRQNDTYGVNDFIDNGDLTITDNATNLMWAQDDSGGDAPEGFNWVDALAYVEAKNDANYLGYNDWRLPSVKELQSIVDYDRSPDTTNSAAIDPLFNTTPIINEAGETDYAFYWSGTTHANWTNTAGSAGAYISFGRAMGFMGNDWQDVHGAGAQRSDPKSGDPSDFSTGRGPQGDAIRIYNFVRLVRGGDSTETPDGDAASKQNTNIKSNDNRSTQTNSEDAPIVPQGAPGGGMPDLVAAATKLGITVDILKVALGDPSQGQPDFAAAAYTLGITEAELIDALGLPNIGRQSGGPPPANTP